jgi:hypothetical protein
VLYQLIQVKIARRVNDTVFAFGTPLVDDPDRIGTVTALGVDEVLFVKHR